MFNLNRNWITWKGRFKNKAALFSKEFKFSSSKSHCCKKNEDYTIYVNVKD